jgi:hypothetical protein
MSSSTAFLVMFALQVVASSVVFPEFVIRRVRRWMRETASERFRELYPEQDLARWVDRFAIVVRILNYAVAAYGIVLLGWFFTVAGRADWASAVKYPHVVFIIVQFSPILLLTVYGVVRGFQLMRHPPLESRRSASLQRRTLSDFVSPFAVWLAAISYVAFVAIAVYLDLVVYGNETLSRHCLMAIGAVTFVYVLNGVVVYKYLYGKKNPFVSQEGRAHAIAVNVKGGVYGSTATAWFVALIGVLSQPHLREWQPFALAAFVVFSALLGVMGMSSPPARPGADEAHSPGAAS